ncbi:uncharacterized protein LOC127251334 [Andrographis paniculata]|uniref:uncharacterized protein LOC127251334 n=1 Tax=Andrographis paniculata TaxID=175694 RepID=UPI0021E87268|nr:uncharacterized protein LOC127251334 [Andrographis paniculata]
MAEAPPALCFSTVSASINFSKEPISSPSTSFPPRRFSSQFQRPSSRSLRFSIVRSSGSDHLFRGGDDGFGSYPWEYQDGFGSSIEWVPEDKVTFLTSDGLIQFGGKLVPRRVSPADKKKGKVKRSQKAQRFQESNYVNPNQILCVAALFDIAATNGLDMGRRLCIFGFCRSIERLCDVVEDSVLEHGGEVMVAEKDCQGGLREKLTMTVAVPFLWGVPPASETLHLAVKSGGGIVEKVSWKWNFM